MSLVVVGSVALDSVEVPSESRVEVLGGSSTFFSVIASMLTEVKLVGVVGDDFPEAHIDFLKSRGIDMEGLERVEGKTFRWGGRYSADFSVRETLFTHLNVFEHFSPRLPTNYQEAPYVFLANIHPSLQLQVLDQIKAPKFVACDTMNLWINTELETLMETLKRVDLLFINDEEARLLSGSKDLLKAEAHIRSMGPKVVVIKKGEHGLLMAGEDLLVSLPAFPTRHVLDPTGAGDAFAGGFMGIISQKDCFNEETLRLAAAMGAVAGSFNVEGFGHDRFRTLTAKDLENRLEEFRSIMKF